MQIWLLFFLICTHKVSLREPELDVWRLQIWSSLHETVLWAGSGGLGCCHTYRWGKLIISTKTLTGDKMPCRWETKPDLCACFGESTLTVNICPHLSKQRLRGFFNDATSFNIAIDMLFTKGHYESKWQINLPVCCCFLKILSHVRIIPNFSIFYFSCPRGTKNHEEPRCTIQQRHTDTGIWHLL